MFGSSGVVAWPRFGSSAAGPRAAAPGAAGGDAFAAESGIEPRGAVEAGGGDAPKFGGTVVLAVVNSGVGFGGV